MQNRFYNKRIKRWVLYSLSFILLLILFLTLIAGRIVEPLLKDRIHTLIIEGSDSLYQYTLGGLNASFFGGSVEVENLQVSVDSGQYNRLKNADELPSVTMELDLVRGHISGIQLLPLLFGKSISIDAIMSKDADIRLIRHRNKKNISGTRQPLWKLVQPKIKKIKIDNINLDGIKLLYKNADTSESLKLQFDTCFAYFRNIRIDSAAAADTSRIGFAREVSLRFRDLKFRSADSSSKLKAEVITYSSAEKKFEIIDFKMQPTLKEKKEFYKAVGKRQAMEVIEFGKMTFTNFQFDRFILSNIIQADSVFLYGPRISIYLDKTYPPSMENKSGKYPHQRLLNASSTVRIKGAAILGAQLTYVERGEKTRQEGKLFLSDINAVISNITNDSFLINRNNKCRAEIRGNILGNSPIKTSFTFYLDSTNGRFDATGEIKNIKASQLNGLAIPLANTQLQSFNMHLLNFNITGNNDEAISDVRMLYDDLFIVLRKTNKETGITTTNKFLTKVVNKYTLQNSNPAPAGRERIAQNIVRNRTTSQSFFALIWKTIFAGMQTVMMHTPNVQ
jgi:hypothetical protein